MRVEVKVLRCVLCHGDLTTEDGEVRCVNGHTIPVVDGILDLRRPFDPADPRLAEEYEYADGAPEAERTRIAPWLWLTRFPYVHRFEKEILPRFGPGRFLELGGGSCYASGIVKSTWAESVVYATDVAVNTLRNKARPVLKAFPQQPDFLAAIAAEDLPFKDETVDYIFGELFIHHSNEPSRILSESARILRPGGRMVFLEPSVPGHFVWLFHRDASTREHGLGIHEGLLSYGQWRKTVESANLPSSTLIISTDAPYHSNHFYAIAGSFLSLLPKQLVASVFPTGAIIDYRKPATS
ncbi:MAG: class I SAM-dependent methyltransferase [Chloroflexi bacterium]|nr:class I SAM-dependent methyltransferase [Chloroflexota bacterium]